MICFDSVNSITQLSFFISLYGLLSLLGFVACPSCPYSGNRSKSVIPPSWLIVSVAGRWSWAMELVNSTVMRQRC